MQGKIGGFRVILKEGNSLSQQYVFLGMLLAWWGGFTLSFSQECKTKKFTVKGLDSILTGGKIFLQSSNFIDSNSVKISPEDISVWP